MKKCQYCSREYKPQGLTSHERACKRKYDALTPKKIYPPKPAWKVKLNNAKLSIKKKRAKIRGYFSEMNRYIRDQIFELKWWLSERKNKKKTLDDYEVHGL
jgi:hypothetical protein